MKTLKAAAPSINRWLAARRELLKSVKSEVVRRLGEDPADVKAYTSRYERDLKKPWTVSSKAELLSEIDRADIVYGGDFHALAQAQRTHLRILRSLSDERPVVLALECFAVKSQKWLDAYLRGELELEDLCKKTKWAQEWGFPWENYKPLFELARHKKFKLLAVNTPSIGEKSAAKLDLRDRDAAKVIKQAARRNPGALIYVIFGDLHLAKDHLPKAVKQEYGSRYPLHEVTVHLNSERIYFELAEKGIELTTDVVKLGPGQFCIQSSPPWVKWQSYLFFLDHAGDRDGDERIDGESDFDATDQVAALVRLAASDLGVEVKVDDLSVYGEDDERVWREVGRQTGLRDREIAQSNLKVGRSFYLPKGGTAYLPRATINHAAGLAGHYLHAKLSGRKRNLWQMPNDFRGLIWTEAVSYFISKLVNHSRKAETLTDLKTQITLQLEKSPEHEALRLVLDMSLTELIRLRQGRKRALQVRPRRMSSYLEAARILGGMMGERLYLAYRSRKLNEDDILRWLKRDVSSKTFSETYDEIVERLADMDVGGKPAKTRKERL